MQIGKRCNCGNFDLGIVTHLHVLSLPLIKEKQVKHVICLFVCFFICMQVWMCTSLAYRKVGKFLLKFGTEEFECQRSVIG
jgi:hypothetical protein